MLYIQLAQVMLRKPKRGRTFWGVVVYSSLLFPLATLALAGMFKFEEMLYIDNSNYPGGSRAFRQTSNVFDTLSRVWSVMVAPLAKLSFTTLQ